MCFFHANVILDVNTYTFEIVLSGYISCYSDGASSSMRKCTFAAMAESLCRCVCLLIILSLITSFCHGTSCNDIGCAQLVS